MLGAPAAGSVLDDRYVLSAVLRDAPGYLEYRAYDREIEVEVGLWWLRPELFADPARRNAVVGAGVELRGLKAPTVRQCFGVGRGRDGVWATWQPESGPAPRPGHLLTPATPGEPVPLDDVRRWVEAVARGLAYLHGQGVVHGRLTPHDVVSVGGVLKLGGGGLWRDVDPVASLRAWAAVPGGESYLAPEVRRHQAPAEAADIWSLAAIALEMVAGVPGGQLDASKAAARRHPTLAAVLVGAMKPDPGSRPDLGALVEAVGNAAASPYLDAAGAAPRGKQARGGEGGTLIGHASGAERATVRPGVVPPTSGNVSGPVPVAAGSVRQPATAAVPPTSGSAGSAAPPTSGSAGSGVPPTSGPAAAARPSAARPVASPGVPPRPGAYAPEPASYQLPTPSVAPRAPRPTAPVVHIASAVPATVADPGSRPHAGPAPIAIPPPALPTPARQAIAGAIDRARTAPPGAYVIAAVSLKGPGDESGPILIPREAETTATPAIARPKLRAIGDMQGGRTFSMAPGQMGYLAPPKAVSDAEDRRRRNLILLLLLIGVLAGAAGVVLALTL